MMIKGKKGMIAILILAIFFFAIMGTLFIKLQSKKSQFNATLGETQLELIEKYTKGEQILFYIDQASKYSIYEAVYDLSLNGGFFDYKCGDYNGYGLWQSEKEDIEYCSPDYRNNFGKFISTRLDSYLSKGIFEINPPIDNYDFIFEEDEKTKIHGIATIPLSIPILCGKDKTECGVYKVKPSFTHQIDYNLNDYGIIKEKLMKITEECKKEQDLTDNENLKQCVYGRMGSYKGLEWKSIPKEESQEEDRNFAFEATSIKKISFHDNNIIYKFAIFIPDEAPPPKIENLKIEEKDNKVKLSWDPSKALDVEKYKIYYNEEINIPKPKEIFNNLNIFIEDEVDSSEISYEVVIEQGKTYYFVVTALDEVGNEIKEGVEAIKYP